MAQGPVRPGLELPPPARDEAPAAARPGVPPAPHNAFSGAGPTQPAGGLPPSGTPRPLTAARARRGRGQRAAPPPPARRRLRPSRGQPRARPAALTEATWPRRCRHGGRGGKGGGVTARSAYGGPRSGREGGKGGGRAVRRDGQSAAPIAAQDERACDVLSR